MSQYKEYIFFAIKENNKIEHDPNFRFEENNGHAEPILFPNPCAQIGGAIGVLITKNISGRILGAVIGVKLCDGIAGAYNKTKDWLQDLFDKFHIPEPKPDPSLVNTNKNRVYI